MAEYTLRDVMQVLQKDWREYVDRFNALSPGAQASFLKKEEFETFHDLLAHIIASSAARRIPFAAGSSAPWIWRPRTAGTISPM